MDEHPRGGKHYPRSTGEFQSWFATDADCLDYLAWLRWPQGFVCPRCQNPSGWVVAGGSYKCASCLRYTAVTADTLFDRRRSPLTVWFAACWQFATAKDGISALGLQRTLEIGSYQTAWAMLHRLRSVLVRPGRDRLVGTVEVDETYFGGEEPGLRGGRQKGKKVLVGVAVELQTPRGLGRCRMGVLSDASAISLERFVTENVEPGSTLVTDGWSSYPSAVRNHYVHQPINVKRSGQPAHVVLPGVHRVASLAKRWILSTHQGSVADPHLQSYLNVLLRWPEASATSVGASDRQWRTGSLEVTAILPSPRFSLSASGCMGTSGSAGAESPTSVKENMLADQVFSR